MEPKGSLPSAQEVDSVSILSQMNPVSNLQPCFPNIRLISLSNLHLDLSS